MLRLPHRIAPMGRMAHLAYDTAGFSPKTNSLFMLPQPTSLG